MAKLRRHDGIAGEDGGAAVGVDRVAREKRGFLQIILADQLENAVVEVEPVPGQNRDSFGDFRSIRVRVLRGGGARLLLLLLLAKRGNRRLDAKAALAFTALGGGLFRRGE